MQTAKEWLLEQLKEFPNHDEYDPKAVDAIADFMEHYAKYYHEQQVKSVDLDSVAGRSEQLPEYDLEYCGKCIQMTNHLNGKCQKCK